MLDKYTQPDFTRCALLTIDLQNDFAGPKACLTMSGCQPVLERVSLLVTAFRKRGLPMVHVVRIYLPDGSNVDSCRRKALEEGARIVLPRTTGAELVREIRPSTGLDFHGLQEGKLQQFSSNEFAVYKPRWGAFYKTALEDFLRDRGVNTLIITGAFFQRCVQATIFEASERDFRIVAVRDGIVGMHEQGAAELEDIGVTVLNAVDFLDALSGSVS
ncbi:nicotinamidase-like amidase [Desulfocurvibacter africanus PCS]|uniref:Nicotinamidase-like amidase n=1 Tax=Desulfocurvibacter africanus PCS TaxID=1262666 RepID=M5Q2A0_DESAF|nr:cysteine hydrolase [Desulfocurvibacter africanus]EMG37243.1 nicotinamidase-like amidase [Desulfocurvibacter africanus PCS]